MVAPGRRHAQRTETGAVCRSQLAARGSCQLDVAIWTAHGGAIKRQPVDLVARFCLRGAGALWPNANGSSNTADSNWWPPPLPLLPLLPLLLLPLLPLPLLPPQPLANSVRLLRRLVRSGRGPAALTRDHFWPLARPAYKLAPVVRLQAKGAHLRSEQKGRKKSSNSKRMADSTGTISPTISTISSSFSTTVWLTDRYVRSRTRRTLPSASSVQSPWQASASWSKIRPGTPAVMRDALQRRSAISCSTASRRAPSQRRADGASLNR